LTHNPLTPLYRLVTPKIILKSRIRSVPNPRKHLTVIKAIAETHPEPLLSEIDVFPRKRAVFCCKGPLNRAIPKEKP